jgi:hypothetical protein
VPVAIALISGASSYELPWGNIMAASVIVTVPLIVLVLIFQRAIVSGLTAGAVRAAVTGGFGRSIAAASRRDLPSVWGRWRATPGGGVSMLANEVARSGEPGRKVGRVGSTSRRMVAVSSSKGRCAGKHVTSPAGPRGQCSSFRCSMIVRLRQDRRRGDCRRRPPRSGVQVEIE